MTTQLWQSRIGRIVDTVETFGPDDIRRRAEALRMQSGKTAHELAWWNETMLVDRQLRRARRSREAALAARRAVAALEVAATRSGLTLDDPDVACIAEALRSVARATVVGLAEPWPACWTTRRSA